MMIPVFQPYLNDEEVSACARALSSKYLGMGSFVGEFEKALIEELKLPEEMGLVTCSTGHAALHMALETLNIGPGDEVITPSFNNVADFQAISAVGADTVFCDIERETLCIDPESIHGAVSDRTKAIIAMDYGACLANHDAISKIADQYGLPVIHDAAHSFGSVYNGAAIGHQSDFTMFSFDPIKNITCIDGGALVIKDGSAVPALQEMRLLGMTQRVETSYRNSRDWNYDVRNIGFRYHLANLHASIGLSQMAKFDTIKARRRNLYQRYLDQLAGHESVQIQRSDLPSGIVPFILCAKVDAPHRSGLKARLKELGIETGIHWRPGHTFEKYANCRSTPLPVTDAIAKEIVSLPFFPDLTIDQVDFICTSIKSYFD